MIPSPSLRPVDAGVTGDADALVVGSPTNPTSVAPRRGDARAARAVAASAGRDPRRAGVAGR